MSKPRVIANHQTDPVEMGTMCDPSQHVTPGIVVELSFDLHDHAAALELLDRATADIRTQIEETRR